MVQNYRAIGTVKDPVTVEEAKVQLRIGHLRKDDTYIEQCIRAAREAAEAFLGRAIMLQTIRETFSEWPCEGYFVPSFPQFRKLTSFSYRDEEGDAATIALNKFYTDADRMRGRFELTENEIRPVIHRYGFNPITIEYLSGWDSEGELYDGAPKEEVPAMIKQGIMEHVNDMYVNRTPVNIARDGRIAVQIPGPIQRLYGAWRVRA